MPAVMSDLYLDHVLIAVHDLDRAGQTYSEVLGFTLTLEGVHPGRGTHNRLIVFGPEYLELIAVRDAAEAVSRPTMASFLESREGIYMFALGTNNIDDEVSRLRGRGVAVEEPVDGARQGAAGSPGYTWRSAAVPLDATPGSETFLIQHNSAVEERYPGPADPTRHPNGVVGVDHLAIAVFDPDAAASRWRDAFGLDVSPLHEVPERGMYRVRVTLGSCYLDFVSPLRSGAMSRFLERNGEGPFLLSLGVRDLSETTAALAERGVPTRSETADADGPGVTVDPAYTHGVPLQFLQANL